MNETLNKPKLGVRFVPEISLGNVLQLPSSHSHMVLLTQIVGNELLILAGVIVATGGWFLAHRHGRLRGVVEAGKDGAA